MVAVAVRVERVALVFQDVVQVYHRFVILAGDSGSHAATMRAPSLMSMVTTRFANDLEVTSETSVTSRPSTGQRQSSGSASRGASSDPGRRRCSLVPSMSPTNTNGFERSNFTLPGTGRLLNRAVSIGVPCYHGFRKPGSLYCQHECVWGTVVCRAPGRPTCATREILVYACAAGFWGRRSSVPKPARLPGGHTRPVVSRSRGFRVPSVGRRDCLLPRRRPSRFAWRCRLCRHSPKVVCLTCRRPLAVRDSPTDGTGIGIPAHQEYQNSIARRPPW